MEEELLRAISMYLAVELVKTKPQEQTIEQTTGYAEEILKWIKDGGQ